MSDLYLELRSRIPVVANQTRIGTSQMQAAQDAVGLSNERIAREIPISEKTWRRWKKDGSVPTYALPKIARVLRLELVEPPREAIELRPEGPDPLEAIAASLDRLHRGQEELLARFDALETPQSPPAAAPRKRQARPRRSV